MEIHASLLDQLEEIRTTRRYLHTIPEIGFDLPKTHAFLWEELEKLEPDELDVFAKTGIRAVFYGKAPKETVAFRADMDALELTELNRHDYVSTHDGCMHACGHDGHMTVLLTWAKYLSRRRDQLMDNIVLLFQPAEEGVGGAKAMIDDGALKKPDVDRIYGLHVDPLIDEGKIGVRHGYMMASTTEFNIHIQGLSAHGASPHFGVDAIVAAASFIQQLQTVISRSVAPFEKSLITIGKIDGGESRNIIAENVTLYGTFRTFNQATTDAILRRIDNLLRGLELSFGVKCRYDQIAHFPSVCNDEALTDDLLTYLDSNEVEMVKKRMIAEDFSFYQQEVPGVFFFLGVRKGEYNRPLHSNRFDFDEESLLYGLEVYRRLLNLE